MAIDELSGWFIDEAKNGFKIDGLQQKAGNIPTGNGSSSPKNKFICTVNELANYYRSVFNNPPKEQEDVTGDDSDLLAFTRVIFSTSRPPATLTQAFRKAKSSMKPNSERQSTISNMLRRDLMNYDLSPDHLAGNNTLILAKTDIYRYTSLLVLNLGIQHGETTWNSLTTIYQMYIDDLISECFTHALKTALLLAMYIRLSCYLHHDSQQEDITILERITSANGWFLPKSLFITYYSAVVEVKCLLEQRYESSIQCRYEAAISVALCLNNYVDAILYADYLLSIDQLQSVHVSLQMTIGTLYQLWREFAKAMKIYRQIIVSPHFLQQEMQIFNLNVLMWSIMIEIDNPEGAEVYLDNIKRSPLLQQYIIRVTNEAYNTTRRIIHRDGRQIKVDTQFMERALLTHDLSNDTHKTMMYAYIHCMNDSRKLAIEWAEKSLEIHKKEKGVGEKTVTMWGLNVLQFLACVAFDEGDLLKSEKYAKRALEISLSHVRRAKLHKR